MWFGTWHSLGVPAPRGSLGRTTPPQPPAGERQETLAVSATWWPGALIAAPWSPQRKHPVPLARQSQVLHPGHHAGSSPSLGGTKLPPTTGLLPGLNLPPGVTFPPWTAPSPVNPPATSV